MIVLDHFASCVLLAADPIIEWIDEIHGLRRISDDMKGVYFEQQNWVPGDFRG